MLDRALSSGYVTAFRELGRPGPLKLYWLCNNTLLSHFLSSMCVAGSTSAPVTRSKQHRIFQHQPAGSASVKLAAQRPARLGAEVPVAAIAWYACTRHRSASGSSYLPSSLTLHYQLSASIECSQDRQSLLLQQNQPEATATAHIAAQPSTRSSNLRTAQPPPSLQRVLTRVSACAARTARACYMPAHTLNPLKQNQLHRSSASSNASMQARRACQGSARRGRGPSHAPPCAAASAAAASLSSRRSARLRTVFENRMPSGVTFTPRAAAAPRPAQQAPYVSVDTQPSTTLCCTNQKLFTLFLSPVVQEWRCSQRMGIWLRARLQPPICPKTGPGNRRCHWPAKCSCALHPETITLTAYRASNPGRTIHAVGIRAAQNQRQQQARAQHERTARRQQRRLQPRQRGPHLRTLIGFIHRVFVQDAARCPAASSVACSRASVGRTCAL